MSLKFVFSNVVAFHGPSIYGKLPHHAKALFNRRIAQFDFQPVLGEGRSANNLAIQVHAAILASTHAH